MKGMDLKRKIISVLIIALFLLNISQTALSDLREIRIIGSSEVLAPAVSSVGGVTKGVLTKIEITVVEGRGDVYVSTSSLTELDMQATARVAAQVACELLGLNMSNYDFLIKVESESIIVGGPSAGAIMTIGMISALTGWKIRENVLMTGTINPDGSVGPVGGIPEKIEAAAEQGVETFLVPLGQTVVVKYEVVKKRAGPFIFTEMRPVKVDLIRYAREKWGVNVIEVADIREAASIFFNRTFEIRVIKEPKYRELTREIFSEVAIQLIDKASSMEDDVRAGIENSDLSPDAKNQLLSFLDEKATKNLDNAKRVSDSMPYVAASLAFRALVALQYVDNILSYREKGLGSITSRVIEVLEKASESIDTAVVDSSMDVEFVMAAEYRLEKAKEKFIKANKTADIYEKMYLLAYSEQQAYASMTWLSLTEKFSEGKELQLDYVREIASDYLLAARNSWSYAYTLMSETGIFLEEVDRAEKAFTKAKNAFDDGDYLLACTYAIEALVDSELALNKIHLRAVQEDITEVFVEKAREKAVYSLSIAQNFTTPILASSYMELADYEEDYEIKLRLYKLSSYYSKLALQLAQIKAFKNPSITKEKEEGKKEIEIVEKENTPDYTPYLLALIVVLIAAVFTYILISKLRTREPPSIQQPVYS